MKTYKQTNTSFSNRTADKTNGIVAGIFFITATVSAIIGLKLYDPLLASQGYLVAGAAHSNQVVLGAILELVLACANVGTGIMLYPYLRRFSESLGLGYVCFRVLEVVAIIVGVVSVLSMLSLSREFMASTSPNVGNFQTIGNIFKAIHDWTFIIGPNFLLGVNTAIYSYVFYRSGLVPRSLAILGIAGAILVFAVANFEMFGVLRQMSQPTILLSLPIASYEMILAVWLIFKGFNTEGLSQKNMTRQIPSPVAQAI